MALELTHFSIYNIASCHCQEVCWETGPNIKNPARQCTLHFQFANFTVNDTEINTDQLLTKITLNTKMFFINSPISLNLHPTSLSTFQQFDSKLNNRHLWWSGWSNLDEWHNTNHWTVYMISLWAVSLCIFVRLVVVCIFPNKCYSKSWLQYLKKHIPKLCEEKISVTIKTESKSTTEQIPSSTSLLITTENVEVTEVTAG